MTKKKNQKSPKQSFSSSSWRRLLLLFIASSTMYTNVQTRNVAKASAPSTLASPLVVVVVVVFMRIPLLGDVTVKTRLCAGMTTSVFSVRSL